MNDSLLEELLNEDESAALDFKRNQYPLSNDDQKGELIKDVLAMANAFRRATAFILIGVDDVKGGRSIVVGVTEHLKDADLQQLINSKTNRAVTFAYLAYPFEGKQVGILEIGPQARPIFLRKSFGKLDASAVYLRHGSSTAVADADDVARMAIADAGVARAPAPAFEIDWTDLYEREPLGSVIKPETVVLTPKLDAKSLMPSVDNFRSSYASILGVRGMDEDYYQRVINYTYKENVLSFQGLCVRNTSGTAAQDVLLKCRIPKTNGLKLYDGDDRPELPHKYGYIPPIRSIVDQLAKRPDPHVASYPDHWEIGIQFGTILPRETVWTTDVLLVGATRELRVDFPFELYASNLPTPLPFPLSIEFNPAVRAMTHADLPTHALRY